MLKKIAFFAVVTFPVALVAADFSRAGSTTPGVIQNVQSYNANPYASPDSPYNTRFPTPVYVAGSALTAAQCRSAASAVVASVCAMHDNCMNATVSDITPSATVAMSAMPGGNYSVSCAGFIPNAFDEYIKSRGTVVAAANFPSSFPAGGGAAFPTAQQLTPEQGRANELAALRAQTGADDNSVLAAAFPGTFSDVNMATRMETLRAGYEPWRDASAYVPLGRIESKQDYLTRKEQEARTLADIEMQKYRAANPGGSAPQSPAATATTQTPAAQTGNTVGTPPPPTDPVIPPVANTQSDKDLQTGEVYLILAAKSDVSSWAPGGYADYVQAEHSIGWESGDSSNICNGWYKNSSLVQKNGRNLLGAPDNDVMFTPRNGLLSIRNKNSRFANASYGVLFLPPSHNNWFYAVNSRDLTEITSIAKSLAAAMQGGNNICKNAQLYVVAASIDPVKSCKKVDTVDYPENMQKYNSNTPLPRNFNNYIKSSTCAYRVIEKIQ